jgi:hypothetical protein
MPFQPMSFLKPTSFFSPRTKAEFEAAVSATFAPLAERHNLKLSKVADGVFIIAGSRFNLRIRAGIGHDKRDFHVTLAPVASMSDDPYDFVQDEIGLAMVAKFQGHQMQTIDHSSADGYRTAFEYAARTTENVCLPYLTGDRDDFDDLKRFVEAEIQASGIRSKKYRFPKNVREEWI